MRSDAGLYPVNQHLNILCFPRMAGTHAGQPVIEILFHHRRLSINAHGYLFLPYRAELNVKLVERQFGR